MINSNKFLVDTNILIYSIENSDRGNRVIDLLQELQTKEGQLFISTQNILEFERVVTHKNFSRKFTYKEIEKIEELWLNNFTLIGEDLRVWEVFRNLKKIYKPKENNVFDLWIVCTMQVHGISTIITDNVKHFSEYNGIRVIKLGKV